MTETEKHHLPLLNPVRECGGCTACCTALAIIEIEKDERAPCPYNCGSGCDVYGDRPIACRDYACFWLLGWGNEQSDRPDRLGIIFDQGMGLKESSIVAREIKSGAVERHRPVLRRLARNGARFNSTFGPVKADKRAVAVDCYDGSRFIINTQGIETPEEPRVNITFEKRKDES